MEQLVPFAVGLVAAVIAFKVLKGIVKMIGLVVIVALVAAIYFGMLG